MEWRRLALKAHRPDPFINNRRPVLAVTTTALPTTPSVPVQIPLKTKCAALGYRDTRVFEVKMG